MTALLKSVIRRRAGVPSPVAGAFRISGPRGADARTCSTSATQRPRGRLPRLRVARAGCHPAPRRSGSLGRPRTSSAAPTTRRRGPRRPSRAAFPAPPPPPRPGRDNPADPSARGLNRSNSPSPDAPATPFAPCKELKPANDCRMNCGLNGPPASDPLTTIVRKKLELRHVPRAALSEPLSKPDRLDDEPLDDVRSPSSDDSPVAVDAPVLPAELPLVPAEVAVAWAAAAAWPASPAELVVGCGAANGVNCEAAADEPA